MLSSFVCSRLVDIYTLEVKRNTHQKHFTASSAALCDEKSIVGLKEYPKGEEKLAARYG